MTSEVHLPAHGWKPRFYQVPVWREAMKPTFRRAVLAWARRLGKDEVAMHITAIKAHQRVGVYYHCLPEYAQARKVLWDMRNPRTGRERWKDIFPPELIKHIDNQSMKITFHNNSVWQLIGSDNIDSLVGGAPVGIVMSEAAISRPDAFAYFEPMLLENKGWSIHVSSVRGKNHFYNEYMDALADPNSFASHLSAYDVNVFDKDTLDKTRKTYISRYGAVLGNALFSQEFESKWEAAVVGAVWAEELVELSRDRAIPIKYDPRYPVHTSWDLGSADGTVILYWQVINRVPRLIDWSSVKNRGLATCAEILRSKPYKYGEHIGPHDIMSKTWELDGISRYAEALKQGIKFTPIGRPARKNDGIAASSQLIQLMEVNVSDKPVEDPTLDCAFIVDTLKQYRYAFDQEKNILSKVPVHDWTSHYADALQTFAIYLSTSGASLLNGKMKLQDMKMADEAFDLKYSSLRMKDIMAMRGNRSNAMGGWNAT